MSYSFALRGPDKADVLARIGTRMDQVVQQQPEHAADRDIAVATVTSAIGVLAEDATKNIEVSMSGSMGWRGTGEAKEFTQCNVSVNAYLSNK